MKHFFSLFISVLLFFVFPEALSEEERQFSSAGEEISTSIASHRISSFQKASPSKATDDLECHIPAGYPWKDDVYTHVFEAALQKFPCNLLQSLKTIEVIEDPNMPRALSGRSILKLRSDVFSKPEIETLLLHEFAHVIDLGGLRGDPRAEKSEFKDGHLPIFKNDLSFQFYRISWENESQIKEGITAQDFVGGYAMTDPFEDFAESLLLYRMHGNVFRQFAQENSALQQKYNFFKIHVFDHQEFDTYEELEDISFRSWDVTKLGKS